MNRHRNKIIYGFLFIIITGLFTSCQIVDPPFEKRTYSENFYFEIDPETILDRLSQGQNGIFKSLPKLPDGTPLKSDKQVLWSQNNYLKIAKVYHDYVWKESIEQWGMENIGFRMLCADVGFGPQEGIFRFIKTVNTKKQGKILYFSTVSIEPWRKSIGVWKEEFDPMIQQRKMYNLLDYKINAEEALQIAENNGGSQARLSVDDKCQINLILSPGSRYNGWQVGYQTLNRGRLFDIDIDPITGYFQNIYPR